MASYLLLETGDRLLLEASGSGLPVDADAQAYFDAVTTAGGTISASARDAYNVFVTGLKADGLWPKIDRLGAFFVEDEAAALTCLKSLATFSKRGTPAFTALQGFAPASGDAVYMAANPGPTYVQNSAHAMFWSLTNDVNGYDMGASSSSGSGGPQTLVWSRWSDNKLYARLNSAAEPGFSGVTASIGQFIVTRSDATNITAFKDGVSLGTAAAASTGVPSAGAITACGGYYQVHPTNFVPTAGATPRACAMFSWGGGLTSTEAAAYYARCNTFRAAMASPTPPAALLLEDQPARGSASITLGALTSTATGRLAIKGTTSVTLGPVTVAATGAVAIKAAASVTLGSLGLVSAGVVGSTPIIGTASITLGALSLAATGTTAQPVVSGGFGPGWNIEHGRDRERVKDRAELRRMLERAVLGIEDAPPSPVVAQAEQLLAPYRRPDDTVNTAAIALQIDIARQLLDLHARIAEIQRQATEQDDEEAAMLLLAA